MNTYKGRRVGCAVYVTVDGFPLDPRLDLLDYSPNGFEWGYDGKGPAQLSLAILADFLRNDNQSILLHRDFKRIALIHLNCDYWTFCDYEIRAFVSVIQMDNPVMETRAN